MKKQKIKITLFAGSPEEVSFSGRLLGLLADEEVSKLLSDNLLCRKVRTGESVPVNEVSLRLDSEVENAGSSPGKFRLVLDAQESGKNRLTNTLLITDIIDDVTSFPADDHLGLLTADGDWMSVEEDN